MRPYAAIIALFVVAGCPEPAAADEDEAKIAFNSHCRTCHSFRAGDNRLGPSLFGIFGARAGEVHGYRGYSGGLTGLVWDEATLDRFIADPAALATSTNMTSPPVADASERRKIIEFLKSIRAQ